MKLLLCMVLVMSSTGCYREAILSRGAMRSREIEYRHQERMYELQLQARKCEK